jgi:hypothetical protein
MAASDSSRLGDLMPFWFLFTPGCSNPDVSPPQEGDSGKGSMDGIAGALPWGCDPSEPGPQDQA